MIEIKIPESGGGSKQPRQRTETSAGTYAQFFVPMGFNLDESRVQAFYFYSRMSNSLIRLTASKFSKQNLLMLAPLSFWEDNFGDGDGRWSNIAAGELLVLLCNSAGFFVEDAIRGRGAWLDNDRVVIHTGTSLIIAGQKKQLFDKGNEFIYELGRPLNLTTENPLTASEAAELPRLLSRLNWSNLMDGKLLAGWLAIAPICGVLNWRPHIWVTGAKNSGKSWLFENIIQRMLKSIAIFAQNDTSAAGVRQSLKNDALCVIFDEAEGENDDAQRRMANVMGLMRASSSGKGAPILKGTAGGVAQEFYVRSCFAFASIIPQFSLDSDKRRITLFELRKLDKQEVFNEVETKREQLLTKDWISRFHARMVGNIPKILETINKFTHAITLSGGSRALGDQLGAMLGGWWFCFNDNIISTERAVEEAKAVLLLLNLEENSSDLTDEERCLNMLLSKEERIETAEYRGAMTVGELVEIAALKKIVTGLSSDDANDRIKRLGLKVGFDDENNECLYVSNTHHWIKTTLKGTAWASNHRQVLSRLIGAKSAKKPVYYSAGTAASRSLTIPLTLIFES